MGPLPRIAFLVWDTHVQFSLLRLSLRSGDPKETFAARRALRVGLGVALGLSPFTRLTSLFRDTHSNFPLSLLGSRSLDSEITRVARRALRVGRGIALGLDPFTRLTCLVSNAHAGFLLCFIIAGGCLGAKPPFAACCTHRVRVVTARSLRPFAGVAIFLAYITVWLQLFLAKIVSYMRA